MPAACADVRENARGLARVIWHDSQIGGLYLTNGGVQGLQFSNTLEQEVRCGAATLYVPRLLPPRGVQSLVYEITFDDVVCRVDAYTANAVSSTEDLDKLEKTLNGAANQTKWVFFPQCQKCCFHSI